MSDPSDADRLKALKERLRAAKGEEMTEKHHSEEYYSQAQLAWRMVIELVVGLGIGFGIGYGLDSLFGTGPWLMIIFIFLGLAAGIKSMLRSAREVQDQLRATEAGDENGDGKRGGRGEQ